MATILPGVSVETATMAVPSVSKLSFDEYNVGASQTALRDGSKPALQNSHWLLPGSSMSRRARVSSEKAEMPPETTLQCPIRTSRRTSSMPMISGLPSAMGSVRTVSSSMTTSSVRLLCASLAATEKVVATVMPSVLLDTTRLGTPSIVGSFVGRAWADHAVGTDSVPDPSATTRAETFGKIPVWLVRPQAVVVVTPAGTPVVSARPESSTL